MKFSFTPMNESDAGSIQAWRYTEPYAVYNLDESPETLAELLDTRSPHYAVRNQEHTLVGLFAYGTSTHIQGLEEPGLFVGDHMLTIGLGLRPDMTGHGLGRDFVLAGLEFAREKFAPKRFRLYVYEWNHRARRVYQQAGFQRVDAITVTRSGGRSVFIEMQREA